VVEKAAHLVAARKQRVCAYANTFPSSPFILSGPPFRAGPSPWKSSLKTPSQTPSEVCFTNLLGFPQSNQADIQEESSR
jgi:hypothetical protein